MVRQASTQGYDAMRFFVPQFAQIAASFCLLATSAHALTSCKPMEIAGPGAVVSEEGSNPVWWANWIYAGYMQSQKIAVATSSDSGVTLGQPVVISEGKGSVGNLRLGASYPHVYALWLRGTATGRDAVFDASHKHGLAGTWDKEIDFGAVGHNLPQMATDVDNVHVAYRGADGNVAVRNSANDGQTFSAPVVLGKGWGEIVISTVGQNVYVAWNISLPNNRYDTMVGVSHDNGKTFAVKDLSASRPSSADEPIFALDKPSGRLSLVWRESAPYQGVYLQSLDKGVTWSAPLVIDSPARQFMVADEGSRIYISYLKSYTVDGTTDWQIQLVSSTNAGHSFSAPQNLSGPTGISTFIDDEDRPMPWVWSGNHVYRLTGMKAEGVYIWGGRDGVIGDGVYVGPGNMAAPAFNSVVWRSPNDVVSYAACN
jgi:hypothetical protein